MTRQFFAAIFACLCAGACSAERAPDASMDGTLPDALLRDSTRSGDVVVPADLAAHDEAAPADVAQPPADLAVVADAAIPPDATPTPDLLKMCGNPNQWCCSQVLATGIERWCWGANDVHDPCTNGRTCP